MHQIYVNFSVNASAMVLYSKLLTSLTVAILLSNNDNLFLRTFFTDKRKHVVTIKVLPSTSLDQYNAITFAIGLSWTPVHIPPDVRTFLARVLHTSPKVSIWVKFIAQLVDKCILCLCLQGN